MYKYISFDVCAKVRWIVCGVEMFVAVTHCRMITLKPFFDFFLRFAFRRPLRWESLTSLRWPYVDFPIKKTVNYFFFLIVCKVRFRTLLSHIGGKFHKIYSNMLDFMSVSGEKLILIIKTINIKEKKMFVRKYLQKNWCRSPTVFIAKFSPFAKIINHYKDGGQTIYEWKTKQIIINCRVLWMANHSADLQKKNMFPLLSLLYTMVLPLRVYEYCSCFIILLCWLLLLLLLYGIAFVVIIGCLPKKSIKAKCIYFLQVILHSVVVSFYIENFYAPPHSLL